MKKFLLMLVMIFTVPSISFGMLGGYYYPGASILVFYDKNNKEHKKLYLCYDVEKDLVHQVGYAKHRVNKIGEWRYVDYYDGKFFRNTPCSTVMKNARAKNPDLDGSLFYGNTMSQKELESLLLRFFEPSQPDWYEKAKADPCIGIVYGNDGRPLRTFTKCTSSTISVGK